MNCHTSGSIASKSIASVHPEATVAEALALMSARRISSVLVVMQRTAVGIFTERDIVLAANKVLGYPDLQIREVMSSPVLSIDGRMLAVDAYRLMRENGVRHLVVNDPEYDIEGVLTLTDLLEKLPANAFCDRRQIGDLMSPAVRTVTPEQSARHALAEMARHNVSCVIVLSGRQPVGIFSERDVARLFAEESDRWSAPLAELMSRPVTTVPPALSPCRAIEAMREKNIRRLVVVDTRGEIAGVVTQSDLGRTLAAAPLISLAEAEEIAPEPLLAGYRHIYPVPER